MAENIGEAKVGESKHVANTYSAEVTNRCKHLWKGVTSGKPSDNNGRKWSPLKRVAGCFGLPFLSLAPIAYGIAIPIDYFKNRKASSIDASSSTSQNIEKIAGGALPAVPPDGPIHRKWGQGNISVELAQAKMLKNLRKAILEHILKEPDIDGRQTPYVSAAPAFGVSGLLSKPLSCEVGQSYNRGPRLSRDDRHFNLEVPGGQLMGVLDGHSGAQVAELASRRLQALFTEKLKKHRQNVHQAFEEVFYLIQKEIVLIPELNKVGSTAVISYIDTVKGLIYTATLGDSEANIYRRMHADGALKSIPLSCVRDWTSPNDEARALAAMIDEKHAYHPKQLWQNEGNPKNRYLVDKGLEKLQNVSRAFGDQHKNIGRPCEAVIAKPKITLCDLRPGDIALWTCDGLKNHPVYERDIVTLISQNAAKSAQKISQECIDLALKKAIGDNVTVMVIKVT